MAQVAKELWRNVTAGVRHYIKLDPIGNQTHGVVQPGKTFTISPIERRLNQEAAYADKADLFRNGTFILVEGSEQTSEEEIESINSITDAQIVAAVEAALGGNNQPIEAMIRAVDSYVTCQRIVEELVVQDARQSLVDAAKRRLSDLTDRPLGPDGKPMQIAEREVIDSSIPGEAAAFSAQRAVKVR